MTISDNLSPIGLIELAIENDVSIKELLILYTIATGNESIYISLVKRGVVTTLVLKNPLSNGYILNKSLTKLPVITKKTIELFTNINFTRNTTGIESLIDIKAVNLELDRDNVETWIHEYRSLFRGKKAGAMGDKNMCIIRMKEFVKENPQYNKEHILKATARYISETASQEYKYMKFAPYFISKLETIDGKRIQMSKLQTCCDELNPINIETDDKWHGGLKIG